MFNVILATEKSGGIGYCGGIPWYCPEDLENFKKLTMGHVILFGRKTYEEIKHIGFSGREIWILSRREGNFYSMENGIPQFRSIEAVISRFKFVTGKQLFIAGGGEVYDLVFRNYSKEINKIYLSVLKSEWYCDTFVTLPRNLVVNSKEEHDQYTFYEMRVDRTEEMKYLELLNEVLQFGIKREGRNGETLSVFAKNLSFDLRKGFPLLTTKKMFYRGIIEELLFFIRGDTDTKLLEEKKINIWKGNTSREFLDKNGFAGRKEGCMGPMYGYQWRYYGAEYDEKKSRPKEGEIAFDQLSKVINEIKYDPHSRRILLTDFNPEQADEGVLYPCHSIIIQFYVEGDYLDMYCFNRSSDLFLGLPFNIASSSLFLSIIANITDKKPRFFHLSLGDCHIYSEHISAVKTQLERFCYDFPTLVIARKLDIDNISVDDFGFENYHSSSEIKAPMIV